MECRWVFVILGSGIFLSFPDYCFVLDGDSSVPMPLPLLSPSTTSEHIWRCFWMTWFGKEEAFDHAPPVQSFRNPSSSPLNLSRSQRPIPATLWGSGPTAPSVYCHIVQVSQLGGITAVGPYWANQNQQFARMGSLLTPRSSLM